MPDAMPKHRFHGMNPKVMYIHCTNKYIYVIYIYIHVHNMYIHGIYNVYVCLYLIISLIPALLCAGHGQFWQCPLSKRHPRLSAMVGPDESIHMAKYRSLSQNIATDSRFHFLAYTIPCLYFVVHACGLEPLIVLIIILNTYTMV